MSSGLELLKALKANATTSGPCLSIPVGSPVEAVLRPVATTPGRLNANDVRVLTEWRNRHVTSFLTQFEATEAVTEKWLTEMVGPDPSRILFMIDDPHGQTIGYFGLAFINWEESWGEPDALVRGVPTAPGVMSKTMITLLEWAHEQLGLKTMRGRVRSDNPALRFFLKIGKEMKRVSLRPVEEAGKTSWVEDESLAPGDPALVYIDFTRPRNQR